MKVYFSKLGDSEEYFNELRNDRVIYFNPTQIVTIGKAINLTGRDRIVLVAEVASKIKTNN